MFLAPRAVGHRALGLGGAPIAGKDRSAEGWDSLLRAQDTRLGILGLTPQFREMLTLSHLGFNIDPRAPPFPRPLDFSGAQLVEFPLLREEGA